MLNWILLLTYAEGETLDFEHVHNMRGYFLQCFRPVVSKLRPTGQMRPAKPFHPAREAISSMMKKLYAGLKKNLLIW